MKLFAIWALVPLLLLSLAYADGPGDNIPDKVRPIPPAGIAVSDEDRKELEAGIAELGRAIEALRSAGKPAVLDLLPDVQIFHNTARYALTYNEFFKKEEIGVAKAMLKQGLERAGQLRDGKAPWATATGLVVRGYVSRIDGSVQPYGLVVPATYQPNTPHHFRLDVWLHGRGENQSELNFLDGRQKSPGEFTPADTIVLHPYGRYCCANKFAGEIDLFEALEQVRKRYPIDEDRLVVRGFSMGGAACWQFAVHYPGMWAAAAPGAGFSETADFLKVFQDERVKPTWYEQKLWHMYDCTDYAVNLFNCPTVAYSGEIDKQKQAADMMAKALEAEGITLTHLIGPKTAYAYHKETKQEINERIDRIAARGRNVVPTKVRFTTWTLRYNECLWVRVDGMNAHWERARVDAELVGDGVKVKTENVRGLTLSMRAGECPFDNTHKPKVVLDGQEVECAPALSDRSWTAHFRKADRWAAVGSPTEEGLHKIHGLQGPIDDAFMDSFLIVKPSGTPLNKEVGAWEEAEMNHAIAHWRNQFRGEPRVKTDDEITDANSPLTIWSFGATQRAIGF